MKIKHLRRRRGDTDPYQIVVTDADDEAMDITAASFKLTVNSAAAPDDETDQVFQSAGSIIGAAENGRVDFPLSADNADNAGSYYYDIEMTSAAGKLKTLQGGNFIMTQDITKT